MQFFPTDDLRSLCKDEKSFRALSEMVQSYLALSGAGVGKEYWASYLAHCSDLVLEVDLAGKVIAVHSTGKSNGKKQFIGRNLMHLLPSSLAKKFPAAIEKAFKEQQPERLFLDSETDTAFLVLSPVSSPSGMNSALAIFPASKFKSGIAGLQICSFFRRLPTQRSRSDFRDSFHHWLMSFEPPARRRGRRPGVFGGVAFR